MLYNSNMKEKVTNLNTNTTFIKLLGIITMTIDHIGSVIFPNVLILRIIGRIAFPLFAWCILLGYYRTSNIKKYIIRLLLVAVISQPIYCLLFNYPFYKLNVIFTLLLEILFIYSLDKKKYHYIPFVFIVCILLKVDYKFDIIIFTLIYYYFRNFTFAFILSFLTYSYTYAQSNVIVRNYPAMLQCFSILSLPIIVFNTKILSKLKINKYLFYLFYPTHLLILYIIKLFL